MVLAEGMPEGVDVDALLDAIDPGTELASVEVVSQTDAEAVVKVQGSLSMDIDVDAMGPFIDSMGPYIESMMEASGMEVTPETVDMFTGLIKSQLLSSFQPEVTDIDAEITMVPGEDGTWLVCSDLGAMAGGTADASMAPATRPWHPTVYAARRRVAFRPTTAATTRSRRPFLCWGGRRPMSDRWRRCPRFEQRREHRRCQTRRARSSQRDGATVAVEHEARRTRASPIVEGPVGARVT